jgi:hypothetical protein
MVHEQLCSIRDLYLAMSIKVSDINQISRGNALLVGGKSSSSARAASDEKTFSKGEAIKMTNNTSDDKTV